MLLPVGLQLWTLREMCKQDFVAVLKAVAEIGYCGVEFGGLHGKDPRELRRILDDLGLQAPAAHMQFLEPGTYAQTEDTAAALGCKHLVNAWLGPEVFATDAALLATVDRINAAVSHFTPRGYHVCLHNHEHEFDPLEKGVRLCELVPGACLEADIYWLQTCGVAPIDFLTRYRRRTHLLHVKDGPCGRKEPMTAVGQGALNISAIVREAEKAEVEWLIVEIDRCGTDMLRAVKESYDFLTQHGLAHGR